MEVVWVGEVSHPLPVLVFLHKDEQDHKLRSTGKLETSSGKISTWESTPQVD